MRKGIVPVTLLLVACANAPTPLTEERPPPSPIAARVEGQLSDIAKYPPRAKGKAKKTDLVLAAAFDAEGHPLAGERPAVAFSFRVFPPRPETPAELRDAALLGATVDADGKNLVVAIRTTSAKLGIEEEDASGTHEAAYEKVQIILARKRDEAGSHDARMHVARVFGLDPTQLEARYAGATLSAFVLGTKLVRSSGPAAFRDPGDGTWTLLRIVSPGEGYLAIDWDAGRGEIFPVKPGPTELGPTLLKVM